MAAHARTSSGARVLELFCGLGGCAAAVEEVARVVCAIDVHRTSVEIYRHNFPHPARVATIEALPAEVLRGFAADVWWLSPPCQPYTTRGNRRDVDDPRARSLLALLSRIDELRPSYVALENVPGFADSRMRRLLLVTLEGAGYTVAERLFCPSELGVPNRRRRYYLVAARGRLETWPDITPVKRMLADHLEPDPPDELYPDPAELERYAGALDVVDAADPGALTSCFTSAYGRSWVRSGSYLQTERGLRRFSPREILSLLGFPGSYTLPPELPLEKAWPLVGNSLSIPAVRATLAAIPGLGDRI